MLTEMEKRLQEEEEEEEEGGENTGDLSLLFPGFCLLSHHSHPSFERFQGDGSPMNHAPQIVQ